MKNSDKIDILKEIQRELEIRKSWKPFFLSEFLSIEFDVLNDVLYCNWKDYQSEASVMTGCEKILEALPMFRCRKILNDNTNVVGIWTPAAMWVAEDWFPRLLIAGLKKFAWIYSPSVFSQVSTNEVLRLLKGNKVIKTFDNVPAGMQWLMTTKL